VFEAECCAENSASRRYRFQELASWGREASGHFGESGIGFDQSILRLAGATGTCSIKPGKRSENVLSSAIGTKGAGTIRGSNGLNSMRLIRRFVLLISLLFWQGGFMFYGGVVVAVGG
jgi:hypothetical protein